MNPAPWYQVPVFPRKRLVARLSELSAYALLRLVMPAMALLPWRFLYAVARAFGVIAYRVLRRDRERAMLNLRLAFDDRLSPRRLQLITRGMFLHLGMMAAECLKLFTRPNRPIWERIAVDGAERIAESLAKGHGAVIFTAHCGNWEFLAIGLYRLGYTGLVFSRRIRSPEFQRLVKQWRQRLGILEWSTDDSPKALLNCLKRNVCIGVLNDQDISRASGIFVNFFGIPAYTARLVSDLSFKTGAPLVPCLAVRRKNKTHVIRIWAPIAPSAGEEKDAYALRSQQEYADLLEKMLRRHPTQWVWFHRRWKTRPWEIATESKYPAPAPTP